MIEKIINECNNILELYREDIVAAFGGVKKFFAIPVRNIDYPTRDYFSLGKDEHKGNTCIRGIDTYNRPFVSVCAKYEGNDTNTIDQLLRVKFRSELGIETIFKRYCEKDNNVWTSGGVNIIRLESRVNSDICNNINSLVEKGGFDGWTLTDQSEFAVKEVEERNSPKKASL